MSQNDLAIFDHSKEIRSLIALSGKVSSSRILNLHQIWMESPSDEAYEKQPFFVHPILNRAIILKHNLRRGEEGRFSQRRLGATKIILPFDVRDLSLGGQFMVAGESNFVSVLTRALDYADLDLERDLRLISILNAIPSFDPFLLDLTALHYRFDIAKCYFRLTKSDFETMSEFVKAEIQPLVKLSLGLPQMEGAGDERFCSLLMSDTIDDPFLDILREGLKMTPQQFSSAMFAWKALMFYKQRMSVIEPDLRSALAAIRRIRPTRKLSEQFAGFVERAKERICAAIVQSWQEAVDVIAQYDRAYQSMVTAQKPSQFRRLLLDSHGRYMTLGMRVARMEHIAEEWTQRTRVVRKALPAAELCQVLVELDRHLCTDLELPLLAASVEAPVNLQQALATRQAAIAG